MNIFEKAKSTLKSSETDDWLDVKVVRPFAYLWALLFARLGVHPNVVTIISMFIGAGSCIFFAHGCYFYEGTQGLIYNLIGVLLLIYADVLDCTDGQLARMTGKTSRLGRILDGAAGFVWFVPIYLALGYRFYLYHDIEFGWLGLSNTPEHTLIASIFVLCLILISGFVCMSGQQRVADYYIQIHLFFQKGEKGSELDNSIRQQQIYDETPWEGNRVWKIFQKSYVNYTRKQEETTPQFQNLLSIIRQKYGSIDSIPIEIRNRFLQYSRPVIFYNGLLTFNFRTFFFILFCLLDVPVLYFIFEVVFMSLLCHYIIHRHEAFCKEIAKDLL